MKDLKTRYSRPALGFFWAVLSPVLMTGIFYIVFGLILKVRIEGVPFVLYLMSGIFPWLFFQDSVMKSVTSLMDNRNLVKESNFPHWLIPVSIVLANGINFLPTLTILILGALFILKGVPVCILLLPVVLGIYLCAAIGMALISSVLFVRWRDAKYLMEAVLQVLFYSTPVFYPLYIVKNSVGSFWFNVYMHNPFVGFLNMYRLTVLKGFTRSLGMDIPWTSVFVTSVCFSVAVLWLGSYYYRINRDTINDYLSY